MEQDHKDGSWYPTQGANQDYYRLIRNVKIKNKISRRKKDKTHYGIHYQILYTLQNVIYYDHSNYCQNQDY